MDPSIIGERHYQVARQVREHLARYRELEDIIAMLGLLFFGKLSQRSGSGANIQLAGHDVRCKPRSIFLH